MIPRTYLAWSKKELTVVHSRRRDGHKRCTWIAETSLLVCSFLLQSLADAWCILVIICQAVLLWTKQTPLFLVGPAKIPCAASSLHFDVDSMASDASHQVFVHPFAKHFLLRWIFYQEQTWTLLVKRPQDFPPMASERSKHPPAYNRWL